MREPSFWWREAGIASALLAPLAAVYGAVAELRLDRRGRRAGAPVVCIGNLTVGGAGKTPTALAVARMLAAAGERPVFLSRGYGGALAGPVEVAPARHHARDVGDEPLLLARAAPTIVARDRVAGAAMAVAAGASVIVMDDGFQNPSLAKDFSVLVVDGTARHRQRPGDSGRSAAGAARGPACPRPCAARGRHIAARLAGRAGRACARPCDLSGSAATGRGRPRRARRQPGARLCRHRRPGEILCHAGRGRHRGRRDAQLSRPSPLHPR